MSSPRWSPTVKRSKCKACGKTVYDLEALNVDGGDVFHKGCFKCEHCECTLSLKNFSNCQGKYYCKPHMIQLFKEKGNYDEAFGTEQHKKKWSASTDVYS